MNITIHAGHNPDGKTCRATRLPPSGVFQTTTAGLGGMLLSGWGI